MPSGVSTVDAIDTQDALPLRARGITPLKLLLCFGKVGLMGFGGVLPVVIHEVITRRRWITQAEFTEIIAICQVMPGPNVVNFSVVLGLRSAGIAGALASVGGILVAPMILVMTLATLYANIGTDPTVQAAVTAISQGAAGLVTAVALKIWWPYRRVLLAQAIAVAVIVAVVVLRLPLWQIIFAMAPVSIALMAWAARGHD